MMVSICFAALLDSSTTLLVNSLLQRDSDRINLTKNCKIPNLLLCDGACGKAVKVRPLLLLELSIQALAERKEKVLLGKIVTFMCDHHSIFIC